MPNGNEVGLTDPNLNTFDDPDFQAALEEWIVDMTCGCFNGMRDQDFEIIKALYIERKSKTKH